MSDPSNSNGAAPATVYDLFAGSNRRSQWRRIPRLTQRAIRLVWESSPRHLAPELALLLGLMLLIGAVAALTMHQQRLLTELVGRRAFDQIISVSSAVELDSFENPMFYDRLQRARTAGMSRPIEMVQSLVTLTTGVTTSVGIGIALVVIEPLLAGMVLVAGVPLMLATLYNSGKTYQFEYGMTPNARERAYMVELLTGRDSAKEVRAFGSQGFLRNRYDVLTDERIDRLKTFLKERLGIAVMGTLATTIGTGIALATLAILLVNDSIGIADAVTAGVAMPLLAGRITAITGSLGKLVEAGMFLDDYASFLALAPADDGLPKLDRPRSRPEGIGSVAVENVSFVYPNTEKLVLDDVSLRIDPGEVVALVGANGSGKTTLVKLICQLYRAQEGHVLWNGVDVDTLSADELRDDMTVIFQDYVQYHLAARDNISLGRVDRPADLASIIEAAGQAGAHDLISALPNGYDTRLGRQFYGGHELSIGQWQRIALARAFFRGGSFLVLDEPTASLDARAEHELFEQMRQLSAGKSVLLVSHRFSSVGSADRIYVLEGGRITESGSHDELIDLGGHYADLFGLQAAAYL
jgi:ATP-binding cassette subfamily B protein